MILSLFLTLTAAFADASSCTAIRLDNPGGSMEGMPRYIQNDLAHCYAVTSAQMIDAFRFSHGDTKKNHITSAVAVAANFKFSQRNSIAQGFQYYRDNKAALVARYGQKEYDGMLMAFSSREIPYVFPVDSYATGAINYGWINEVFDRIQSDQNGLLKSCNHDVLDKNLKNENDFQKLMASWKGLNGSKGNTLQLNHGSHRCSIRTPQILEYAEAIESAAYETNFPSFLQKVVSKVCAKDFKVVALPKVTNFIVTSENYEKDKKQVKPRLQAAFDISKPQPVGLSYCSEILEGIKPNLPNSCLRSHASVLIGRRPNADGGCEYLVRNSSTNCHTKENCENGEYWIKEQTLVDSATMIDLLLDGDAKKEYEAKLEKLQSGN